jgi:hypothetical protein
LLKQGKDCRAHTWELSGCQADLRVELNERARMAMGVAQFNEYVKELEDRHGKEKAAEIVNFPTESQKNVHASKLLWATINKMHPKGLPKDDWTRKDIIRYEMGEDSWKDHTDVIIAEFGLEKADKLLGVHKEAKKVQEAFWLVAPNHVVTEEQLDQTRAKIKADNPDFKFDGTDSTESMRSLFEKIIPKSSMKS